MSHVGGADVVGKAEGHTCLGRQARPAGPPGVEDHLHVRKHLPGTGRAAVSPASRWGAGAQREVERRTPLMHERQQSDTAIVPVKQTNNAGQPGAEAVEGRAVVKGNAHQSDTSRMQSRTRVHQALERRRQAAKREEEGPSVRGRGKPSHVSGYVFGLYRCQSALLAADGYLVWGEERGLHQG